MRLTLEGLRAKLAGKRMSVPCGHCAYLLSDPTAPHGVRCSKGDTSDQLGDFSCFEPISRRKYPDETYGSSEP